MCEFEAGPNPVEQELTGEQIGALLSYFGIDLSDNLESLQQGVVTLAQMQRA